MFETIKSYYEKGLYTDEQLLIFVKAKTITIAQYKEITGKDYNKT